MIFSGHSSLPKVPSRWKLFCYHETWYPLNISAKLYLTETEVAYTFLYQQKCVKNLNSTSLLKIHMKLPLEWTKEEHFRHS